MAILVTGASGLLGNRIYTHLHEKGYKTLGTYHSKQRPQLLQLDLTWPSFASLNLFGVSHAIICSSYTQMDQCKTRERIARAINVSGTKRFIQFLFEHGVFPIFLSTNYVFSGEKGDYRESDKRDATMQYGVQKSEVETFLESSNCPHLTIRVSHVYSPRKSEPTYLRSIVNDLKANKTIRAATDQRFSPTHIDDVSETIERLIESRTTGCFHLASQETYTRYELANKIKSELDIESGKIVPCSIREFQFAEPRPLNTTLCVDKIRRQTNLTFRRLSEGLQKFELCP